MGLVKKNILVGITSSIASYKIYELIRLYKKNNYNVKVVVTKNALNFISPVVIETLSENPLYYEQFNSRDDIEHISLNDWADVFVIAPISANTVSKCAMGIADNLLTSVFCAFLGAKKPILLAPAMNENMYNNPIVQENISKLINYGCEIVDCESGFLACKANGVGRLASIEKIYEYTLRCLFQKKENNNKKIVVTLGGTREKIDSVRYITNSSSGKMGEALCNWAFRFGYDVCAISCVDLLNKPYEVIYVNSAQEMLDKLKLQEFDYLIMSAAVSDFRVENASDIKISKENIGNSFSLNLIKNPDVVSEISKNKKNNQKIIGFCLTDLDLINCAKSKLINKNLDFIVANEISTALNTENNRVTIIDKNDTIINVEFDTKENIAKRILEVTCD